MAQAKKGRKSKDLDPKGRGKKVRGGNLPDDQRNINRSINQIKSSVNSGVVKPVQNSGPTISKAVQNLVHP